MPQVPFKLQTNWFVKRFILINGWAKIAAILKDCKLFAARLEPLSEVLQDGPKATGRIGKNTMLTSLFPSSEFSKGIPNFLAR